MQFTSFGHTYQLGNAVMITSTITVVLFSTVVKYKNHLYISTIFLWKGW